LTRPKTGKEKALITNALTIDVEDWFHPELVRDHVDLAKAEGRVPEAVYLLLNLLNKHRVKATFFILGEVALRYPDLIRQLHREGHELGCHGMSHRMLKDLGEETFRKELLDFRSLTKEILGDVEIKGFRAPTFSLDRESRWALPILRDFGYRYDSSIFPAKIFLNRMYGIKNGPRFPYRISFDDPGREDPSSPLWEFPVALGRLMGVRFPFSGGFYLRATPFSLFKIALKRMNQEGPFNIYLHPWEWDRGTPRVPLSLYSRLVTYYGMNNLLLKLEGLLRAFSFSRMDEVLGKMA
jgi:polysaccharide deacetylase family protein (PEP-CTERM system associated)